MGMLDEEDVDAVQNYVVSRPVFDGVPQEIKNKGLKPLARILATAHPTVLKTLSSNRGFIKRNMAEVVIILIVMMVIFQVLKFFITRPFLIGEYRYIMESRFSGDVKLSRIFAPFGRGHFLKVFTAMSRYNLFMTLWSLTIVGGVYKHYQYYFVKHIIAENPNVKWREARDLSKAMTQGYKFTIFKLQLSYIYLALLSLIPFVELFVEIPVLINASVEMYFRLRERTDIDRSLFIERAFDEKPYANRIEEGEKPEEIKPVYLLKDFSIRGANFDENDHYSLPELTVIFYIFSILGWLYQITSTIILENRYINYGSLYGPWIPVYGVVGVIFMAVLSRFKNQKPILIPLTVLLSAVFLYLTNFYLEFAKEIAILKEGEKVGVINGRISIAGLITFVLGGLLGIYIIGPLIKYVVAKLGTKKSKLMCFILGMLLLTDSILSMFRT